MAKAKKKKKATKKKTTKKSVGKKKKVAKKVTKKKAAKKAVKKTAKKVAKKAKKKSPAKNKAAPKAPRATVPATMVETQWGTSSTFVESTPTRIDLDEGDAGRGEVESDSEESSDDEFAGDDEEDEPSRHPYIGKAVPNLVLKNQHGKTVRLAEEVGSKEKVILYFYPKDDTPGCTTEACGFRDNLNRLKSSGALVLGVSPDSPESHQKFIKKYGLNFDLLSDPKHELADALSVWKEKNFMGKKYMGVERSTFVLNNGKIAKAWQPVKVEGHVDEVLSTVEKLKT